MSDSWLRKLTELALRLARALEVVEARLAEHLLELHGALDGVLDRAVARVERRDRVVLRAAQDGLHLADGAVEHRAAGQAVRGERRERGGDGVLVARDLLAELGTMAPAFSSFTSLPKVSRKASEAFTSSSNSMPFFGRNDACRNRLLFENVSRASTPVTCRASAPCWSPRSSRRAERQDEQAHDLEVPAEGLLGELVGEVATARRVAVVGALLDAVEHLLQRAALGAEDGLALLVAQEAEAAEHAGRPWRFSAVKRASTPFLTSVALAAASLKRSKTSGSTSPRTSAAVLPTSTRGRPGCGRCRGSRRAGEARRA
jgi:hypothetical protein